MKILTCVYASNNKIMLDVHLCDYCSHRLGCLDCPSTDDVLLSACHNCIYDDVDYEYDGFYDDEDYVENFCED